MQSFNVSTLIGTLSGWPVVRTEMASTVINVADTQLALFAGGMVVALNAGDPTISADVGI